MMCFWCRIEYTGSSLYHICPDGTNYAMRLGKSIDEIKEEYNRQDRVRDGYALMRQPRSDDDEVNVFMNWTDEDVEFLKELKIKR